MCCFLVGLIHLIVLLERREKVGALGGGPMVINTRAAITQFSLSQFLTLYAYTLYECILYVFLYICPIFFIFCTNFHSHFSHKNTIQLANFLLAAPPPGFPPGTGGPGSDAGN